MAEFNLDEFNLDKSAPEKDLDPIPFDDSDDGAAGEHISHAPLDLGGGPAVKPTAGSPKPATPTPAPKKTAAVAVSQQDRITGVKVFFTKLHAGAIDFLSDQISEWLRENPGVVIKRTNSVVGEVAAKKTEPNLIITVWY